MRRRRFLTISAAALMARPAGATVLRWQTEALGGTVSVDLRGPRMATEGLAVRIAAIIVEVEAAASLFRPDSALSRLNREGRVVDPPAALRDLLALSDQLHGLTEGLFDPTVQPLWRALAEGTDPAPAQALIGWPGYGGGDAFTLRPGQALTLNGVAQGYAADRVRSLLAAEGFGEALVDLGEYAALGGPFLLGVEDPVFGEIATRRLTGGAIATSSPPAMFIGAAEHILGPHGEMPVWSTVSVEAESAGLADGLSTAFCLADAPRIRRILPALPAVTRVTLVSRDGDVTTIAPDPVTRAG